MGKLVRKMIRRWQTNRDTFEWQKKTVGNTGGSDEEKIGLALFLNSSIRFPVADSPIHLVTRAFHLNRPSSCLPCRSKPTQTHFQWEDHFHLTFKCPSPSLQCRYKLTHTSSPPPCCVKTFPQNLSIFKSSLWLCVCLVRRTYHILCLTIRHAKGHLRRNFHLKCLS